MTHYRVELRIHPAPPCPSLNDDDLLTARRVVSAQCARYAACAVAAPYVRAGLVVDWSVRRTGIHRLGRHFRGRFTPEAGDDGLSGVREPRRPRPWVGGASAALPG